MDALVQGRWGRAGQEQQKPGVEVLSTWHGVGEPSH